MKKRIQNRERRVTSSTTLTRNNNTTNDQQGEGEGFVAGAKGTETGAADPGVQQEQLQLLGGCNFRTPDLEVEDLQKRL